MNVIRRVLIRAVRAARFLPDRWAVRLLYRLTVGRWPNIRAPSTFTEKLQWLKLYDRNPINRIWADKLAVRRWIAETIGPDILIPLVAAFNRPVELFDGIFDVPLQPMMIKASHGSHCGVYIRDQLSADMDAIERRLTRWIRRSWYWVGREWPYRGLTPIILCETWLGGADGTPPDDYKWMCFGGRPLVLQLHQKRPDGHHIDYYDGAGNKLPFGREGYANDGPELIPTDGFEAMIRIAERIAYGTQYLRVDLYYVRGRVYFGEVTLYDSSGFGRYTDGRDAILGALLHLEV